VRRSRGRWTDAFHSVEMESGRRPFHWDLQNTCRSGAMISSAITITKNLGAISAFCRGMLQIPDYRTCQMCPADPKMSRSCNCNGVLRFESYSDLHRRFATSGYGREVICCVDCFIGASGYYDRGVSADVARVLCKTLIQGPSFPRRRGSTPAHWIPACAGMTQTPCLKLRHSCRAGTGPRLTPHQMLQFQQSLQLQGCLMWQ
jgi:hypothetical protein